MGNRQVLIVHGYTASPQANWFPWLAESLRGEGVRVDVPCMPAAHAPQSDAWANTLQEVLPTTSAETFLVGHSLGCIAILRHVLSLPADSVVGGVLLVSGFARTLPSLPMLAGFTAAPLDVAEATRRVRRYSSIFSDSDVIVPPEASSELAAALGSRVVTVAGGGHFLDREGFVQFAQARAELKRLMTELA